MPDTVVVLNPYSGRGAGRRLKDRLCASLRNAGLCFDLVETAGVGHGVELARQARSQGYATIVAAGGDGTFSEVMNGIAQATPEGEAVGRLGLLPIGSGNDFTDMLGFPRDLDRLAATLATGRTQRIDLGHALITSAGAQLSRYFDNNMGVGLEARVTLESYKIKRLSGTPLYVVAALRALRTYHAPSIDMTCEREDGTTRALHRQMLLVSIGNSARTGGGFYITPSAKMDDGLLDVGIVDAVSRIRVLMLLPQSLRGTHVSHPAFTLLRCRSLHLRCEEELPVQMDGEVVTRNADELRITVQPGRLEVVM